MIELNESQATFMRDMATSQPYQVVVRAKEGDLEDKVSIFKTTNEDADILVASGLVMDVTTAVSRPASIDRDYRILGITKLGMELFRVDQVERAQA